MTPRSLAIAVLALALPAAPIAGASEVATTPLGDMEVPVHNGSGFDWNGFYAGIYGVGQARAGNDAQLGIGFNLGYNHQLEFVLLGGEVALQGMGDGAIDTAYGQVLGRTGLLITDDLLIYAAAGYGMELGLPADGDLLVGGGIEVGLTGELSLQAQYLRGLSVADGVPVDQVTLGARFHF